MRTTSTFPVIVGTVVEVACKAGHVQAGDTAITCERGVVFTMEQRPTCTIGLLTSECRSYGWSSVEIKAL